MYAFINNEIVHQSKAFIHVSDLAIQRGYGIFDFFKIFDGHAYFLNDYLDRFYNSAALMRIPVPLERNKLVEIIYMLIARNRLKESGMKMILTGGHSADGYTPEQIPSLIITQHPLTLPRPEVIEQGIKIVTHEYVRDLPSAKTINYTMGIWLIEKIRNAEAADVLYHQDGIVSEFPRCNFFIVQHDNTILTPDINILKGITRKNILQVASVDFKTVEGPVSIDDVHSASEAFLTSTTKRIVPITRIDDRVIGEGKPGPVSKILLSRLIELEQVDGKQNRYAQGRTT